jgi:RHS repeat-associated protein
MSVPCSAQPRFVGDPIDVVTGANFDAATDLEQRGHIPFRWIRYYTSARAHVHGSLGWGHTHYFDRLLIRDLDGLRYEDPYGQSTGFPELEIGESHAANGVQLACLSATNYVVNVLREPDQDFQFAPGASVARLSRLRMSSFVIELRYSDDGRLHEIVDSLGRLILVTHDAAGRIVRLALPDSTAGTTGKVLLSYEYDPAGRLIKGVDHYNTTFFFAYDAAHRVTRRTDRRGYSFFFEYDSAGRCIHSHGEDGLLDVFLEYRPDSTVVRKGNGGQWVYGYNEAGAITHIDDPYGYTTKFVLNDVGQTVSEVAADGSVVELVYDEAGAYIGRRDPFGRFQDMDARPYRPYVPATAFEWEVAGSWAFSSYRLPAKHSVELTKVPFGIERFLQTDPAPGSRNGQRPRGRFVPVGPPKPPGECEFDSAGVLIRYTDPAGATQRWLYDANQNVKRWIDAEGGTWNYKYTSWNLLAEASDPLGHTTEYAYSSTEKTTRIVDPGRTVTEFEYDLTDRLVVRRRHGAVKEQYRYHASATPIEKNDSSGRTLVAAELGAGSLPQSIRFASGETRQLTHDKRGYLVEGVNPAGTIARTYDDLQNVVADLWNGAGVRHGYKGFALVETVVLDKFKTTFEKADDGTVTVTDPAGGVHHQRSLGNGLFRRSLANGREEVSQYDWEGRCLAKAAYFSGGYEASWSRQYHYSPAGNLVHVQDSQSGVAEYQYDAARRLQSETRRGSQKQSYHYDTADNLLEGPGLSQGVVDQNRLVSANNSRFHYDERNHVAERNELAGVTAYEYDSNDQLIRCKTPHGEWTATYDALGRRVSKTWLGKTTRFYWDRERLAAELSPHGGVRVYVYMSDETRTPFLAIDYDHIDADPASGRRLYIFSNQVACPVYVENDARQQEWRATVHAYGKAEIDPQSRTTFSLRFPGHYCDDEIGLHYNRHRYYSPELGRYIQSDPIDTDGGINVYRYTHCPLIEVDLDGRGCPPKNMINAKDDPKFQEEFDKAKKLAHESASILNNTPSGRAKKPYLTPSGKLMPERQIMESENHVVAFLVVKDKDGQYRTVAAASDPKKLPAPVKDHLEQNGIPLVDHKADKTDPKFDDNKGKDRRGDAEQRGLRAVDSNENDEGVAGIATTKKCCAGCTKAIEARGGDVNDPNQVSHQPGEPGPPRPKAVPVPANEPVAT